MDIRRVSAGFAVAPQLELEDFADVAALGYRHIINNRPDGEAPGQPGAEAAGRAAQAAGMSYAQAPFVGWPPPAAVAALETQLAAAAGPVLAYCRSGTRSITAWAALQARLGVEIEVILGAVRAAGYNLDAQKEFLRNPPSTY